jgi:hypothetical protein
MSSQYFRVGEIRVFYDARGSDALLKQPIIINGSILRSRRVFDKPE